MPEIKTELEATFTNVDKDAMRAKLPAAGAVLRRPEFLQKRIVFHLPAGHEIPGAWARVRDEGGKITMSIKIVNGTGISDQKESQLIIDNFEEGVLFLKTLGCEAKAYQETRREIWDLDGVEICIDEWPFLEPFVEIEGSSEEAVKVVAAKLGFDWAAAKFCAVATIYSAKYGLSETEINDHTPQIIFDMENPFLRK